MFCSRKMKRFMFTIRRWFSFCYFHEYLNWRLTSMIYLLLLNLSWAHQIIYTTYNIFCDILSSAHTLNKPLIWYFDDWNTHSFKNIQKKMCLKRCRALNEIFIVPYSIFDCFEVNTHFYTWILRLNNTTTRFATFITSSNNPFVIAERYIMKGNVLSLFLSKYRKFLWSEMDWTLIGIVD